MALKLGSAKIIDLETTFDASPTPSPEGDVIWADVRIKYKQSGLTPTVTIRLPIAWNDQERPEDRKSNALRCARQLIDHACRAAGVSAETGLGSNAVEKIVDADMPVLEGIAQELGLAAPTVQPSKRAERQSN